MDIEEAIRQLQDALRMSHDPQANADFKVGYMREAIRAALEALGVEQQLNSNASRRTTWKS